MENPIQCRPIENPFATSAGSTPLVMLLADTEVDVGATFRSRNLLSDTIVNIKIPETIAITSGFVSLSINDSGDASSERALVTQNSLTYPSSESSQVRRALIPLVTSIQTTVPTQSVIPPQTTAVPATISQPDLHVPTSVTSTIVVNPQTVIPVPHQNQVVQVSLAGMTRTIPIIPRPIHAGREKQAVVLQALQWDTMLHEAVKVNTMRSARPSKIQDVQSNI